MGLRETVERLMKRVGTGKLWGGREWADVCSSGFTGDRTRAKYRATAPAGVKRFASAVGLRIAVLQLRQPARLRAQDSPAYQVAAAEAKAAQAAAILGLGPEPSWDEIDRAVSRMAVTLHLSEAEAAIVKGWRPGFDLEGEAVEHQP